MHDLTELQWGDLLPRPVPFKSSFSIHQTTEMVLLYPRNFPALTGRIFLGKDFEVADILENELNINSKSMTSFYDRYSFIPIPVCLLPNEANN